MVELQLHRFAQQRLAIECHAESRRLQHRKVIRAIANTQAAAWPIPRDAQYLSRNCSWRIPVEDGFRHRAGQQAVFRFQNVRMVAVKPAGHGNRPGYGGEAAGRR